MLRDRDGALDAGVNGGLSQWDLAVYQLPGRLCSAVTDSSLRMGRPSSCLGPVVDPCTLGLDPLTALCLPRPALPAPFFIVHTPTRRTQLDRSLSVANRIHTPLYKSMLLHTHQAANRPCIISKLRPPVAAHFQQSFSRLSTTTDSLACQVQAQHQHGYHNGDNDQVGSQERC